MRIRTMFNLTLLICLTMGLLALAVVARAVPAGPVYALTDTGWLFSSDNAPSNTFQGPDNRQYLMYQDTCPAGAHCLVGDSGPNKDINPGLHWWWGSGSPATKSEAITYTDPIPATTWTYNLYFNTYNFISQWTFTIGYVLVSDPTTLHPLGSIMDGCSNPTGDHISCSLTNSISGSAATPSGPYYIVFDMLSPNDSGKDAYLRGFSLTTCWQIPESALIAAPIALLIPGMLALRLKLKTKKDSN